MKCPHCRQEMTPLIATDWYQIEDYSEDYIYAYKCKRCEIIHNEATHGGLDSWELPESLQPSQKQENAVQFILSRLTINSNELPVTKLDHIGFIRKYLDQAKSCRYRNWE